MLSIVARAIADELEVPEDTLSEDTLIAEDLGADSMAVLSVMVVLEDELEVGLDLSDLPESGTTIGWVVDYLSSKAK